MGLLRLALGYLTGHRNSVPAVLYVGFDANAMQSAIEEAPAQIQRFETGSFHYLAPGKRRGVPTTGAGAPLAEGDAEDEKNVDLIATVDALNGQIEQAKLGLAMLSKERDILKLELEKTRADLAAAHDLLSSASPTPEIPTHAIPASVADETHDNSATDALAGDGPAAAGDGSLAEADPAPTTTGGKPAKTHKK